LTLKKRKEARRTRKGHEGDKKERTGEKENKAFVGGGWRLPPEIRKGDRSDRTGGLFTKEQGDVPPGRVQLSGTAGSVLRSCGLSLVTFSNIFGERRNLRAGSKKPERENRGKSIIRNENAPQILNRALAARKVGRDVVVTKKRSVKKATPQGGYCQKSRLQ